MTNDLTQLKDAKAQKVRWTSADGRVAGMIVEHPLEQKFIPWDELKVELETKLLPQVRVVPMHSTVEVRDLGDRKNWIVRILDPDGKDLGDVWLGTNPDEKWKWDGLVRMGDSNQEPDKSPVWQVFTRYSDGTYRRVEARIVT